MLRITMFADEFQINVQLAYFPPYHSKYNPIERVWGVMENNWNGSLLDTTEGNGILELRFERLPGLEKWFVRIAPLPP